VQLSDDDDDDQIKLCRIQYPGLDGDWAFAILSGVGGERAGHALVIASGGP